MKQAHANGGRYGALPLSSLRAFEAAARLALWLGFEKRGENDDRTAVLLARAGA